MKQPGKVLTCTRRLFHTVRKLDARQIWYHLYYRAFRDRVRRRAQIIPGETGRRSWSASWKGPYWSRQSYLGKGQFRFLEETASVLSGTDWNRADQSKLWLYNLHYLDDLNSVSAEERHDLHAELIERWIQENPPMMGVGWEPYPLSLRLVNVIKWMARQENVTPHWMASIAQQAQALKAQLEYHLLGNHLFSNAKALVFVGTFLDGEPAEEWLNQGLQILDREVNEQWLGDGGHFELSPMYHAAALWDMCDLLNLARTSGLEALRQRSMDWRAVIVRGLDWLNVMVHPDGRIPFFNDAAFGIAPDLEDIQAYAASLGITNEGDATSGDSGQTLSLRQLDATGYIAVNLGNGHKALLDVGHVGPDYQPGHAHADTLSFELSLYGQRVLVNSGTSRYGEDAERQRQRSTPAHNAVSVDGENSSEVWAGFRVARRAYPSEVEIEKGHQDSLTVRCAHDGYLRLPGKVTHRRTWFMQPHMMTIQDELSGTFGRAEAYFHFHPDVQVVKENEVLFLLTLSTGRMARASFSGARRVGIEPSSWHPAFGRGVPNCRLVATLGDGGLKTLIEW